MTEQENKPDFEQQCYDKFGCRAGESTVTCAHWGNCQCTPRLNGMDHVWSTYVVPLQQSLNDEIKTNENLTKHCEDLDSLLSQSKQDLKNQEALFCGLTSNRTALKLWKEIQSENKSLRDEVERLKGENATLFNKMNNTNTVHDYPKAAEKL